MEEDIKNKKEAKGIDAFVLSIIASLTIWFWYICLPASIYALVRSIIVTKKSGRKLAKAAFIISLSALTLCVAIYTQTIFTIMQMI